MRIEHVAIYVNDLEKARDFFAKYFGAVSNDGYHNPKTDFKSYFLSVIPGQRECSPSACQALVGRFDPAALCQA